MQSHDFASTYVGTPYYMSPEICANERYTLASDIWALGCIMYELCTRSVPFNATTQFQLVQKIKDGKLDPMPNQYSPELQEVIKRYVHVFLPLSPCLYLILLPHAASMNTHPGVAWIVQSTWHTHLNISVRLFSFTVFIACPGRNC